MARDAPIGLVSILCDCLEGDYEISETLEEENAAKEQHGTRLELAPVIVARRRARRLET